MAKTPEFQEKQYAFAAHIRDPENNPAPSGIEDRRMGVYRELFFNNLLNLLSSTFPVLTKIHNKKTWQAMIRQFMVAHQALTPYFLEIPREFLSFLEDSYTPGDDDYPFLLELAHYEWLELALSVSEESDSELAVDSTGNMLAAVPVKSSLAWSAAYQFPVHRVSESYVPTEPGDQPTFLVVYRNRADDLGFMELNPVTARLLELIGDNDVKSGEELLTSLAEEISYPDPVALIEHGGSVMEEMRSAGILLGTKQD